MRNFLGTEGFVWGLGVVEDRQDPKKLGRVKVRVFGHHTEDTTLIKTEHLPWALVSMAPTGSAGTSGVGITPLGPVEGTVVLVFFLDGPDLQQPVVLGTLAGIPQEFMPQEFKSQPPTTGTRPAEGLDKLTITPMPKEPDRPITSIIGQEGSEESDRRAGETDETEEKTPGTAKFLDIEGKTTKPVEGFMDPRKNLQNVPGLPSKIIQHEDGTGTTITNQTKCPNYPYFLKEPDLNRLARNEKIAETIVQKKKDEIKIGQENIQTAHPSQHFTAGTTPEKKTENTNTTENVSTKNGILTWTEPTTPYNVVYPYNHVYQSESGHTVEFDDTPGAERIHLYHRAGTFVEVYPDGSTVTKCVNDQTNIILKSSKTHVENVYWLTVDKGTKLLVNKEGKPGNDLDIEIGAKGDLNITVAKGNAHITVLDGNSYTYTNGDHIETITGNYCQDVKGNFTRRVGGYMFESIMGIDYRQSVMSHMVRRTPTLGTKIYLN